MSNHDDVLTVTTVDQDDGLSAPTPLQLPPLAISALMVTKADLIAALRVYVPHLSDIEALDDDRYLLTVGAEHPEPPAPNGNR